MGDRNLPLKKRKYVPSRQHQSEEEEENAEAVQQKFVTVDSRCKRNRLNLQFPDNEFIELKNAFKGILKTYFLMHNNNTLKDVCLILFHHKEKMKRLIENLLRIYESIKFNIIVECTFFKPLTNEKQSRAFKTKNVAVLQSTTINSVLQDMFRKICLEESESASKGSGWSLFCVDGILLRVSQYQPLGGGSYLCLPKIIKNKNAVINPKNLTDHKCFQWAILSRYVCGRNKQRIDNRYFKLCNKFNFKNITFPTTLKQIKIFEKTNSNISVNVYGLNDKNIVYPLRVCLKEKRIHFDLLLLTDTQGISHYCYIKNFSRLVTSQVTKHEHKKIFCKRCFVSYQGSKSKSKLRVHRKNCCVNAPAKITMPCDKYNPNIPLTLKFKNFHYKDRIPIVAYCDFECLLTKVDIQQSQYTKINDLHEPMSFCVYLVFSSTLPDSISSNLPNEPFLYRGKDAAAKFMEYLISIANLIGDLLNEINIPLIPLSVEEQNRICNITHCEYCNLEFSLIDQPVKDHCHLTGKFRNILCNMCNLKRQNQKYLPVLIHGSSNYDSHFIVKQLDCDERKIDVIPNTSEKYISFTKQTSSKIKLKFVDSFRFLGASLSHLVENLPKNKFYHTSLFFLADDIHLVTRKGVYPYEYTNSWDKLDETNIPDKKCFYNSITDEQISEENYKHAIEVWNRFKCKNLGEYSDLYLRTDVLLLADVFENFRDICLENYDLDPAYYLSVPSLTFDAMLKYTKVELELLNDYDKYLFIEKGIRGGITTCVKRHALANNPYMGVSYKSDRPVSYLTYIDANNLYAVGMEKPMPKNSFCWLTSKEIENFDVLSIEDNSPVGYIIESDIGYPTYLHDNHNDLPFLPEKTCPKWSKQKKLLTTLHDKKRYICHYMNLKQAIRNGLVVKRLRRILRFNQDTWLEPYIRFNTEKRKKAKNEFEKDFYKLLNNAMFGKSIENIRKRLNLELVNREARLKKLIAKPNFLNRIIFSEKLSAVECSKENVYFDKPIYIGFTVLELSKYHMYDFHYNVVKKFYHDRQINLLYVDTDSLFYEIFTPDVYDDFNNEKLKKYLDMSDYPENHKCYSLDNKKKLGCFKDECFGIVIVEFIGLRPKLYTFRTMDDLYLENTKQKILKKAKGVTKPVIKNYITFDDYKTCLFGNVKIRRNMTLFRSKKHVVNTITVNKIALSFNDDKRYICENGINTQAYGHYKIKDVCNQ